MKRATSDKGDYSRRNLLRGRVPEKMGHGDASTSVSVVNAFSNGYEARSLLLPSVVCEPLVTWRG